MDTNPHISPETSQDILERLMTFHPLFINLELGRVLSCLEALGRPQEKLPPVIHIAGTNGKGSALATLQAIFEASGKRVHAFISPHLVRYHERMVLAGEEISEEALKSVLLDCENANMGREITHFEITTAAAMLAFSRVPADVLLLEVGLGGRWDATNVIDKPALSIITPVALDHQQFLGDDIATIAADKAGILKKDCPAVIGPQEDEALDSIREEAERVGAPLFVHGQDWQVYEEHGRMVYQDTSGLLDLPLPALVGRHQIGNAGTAIAAVRALGKDFIAEPEWENGLKSTTWPARLQRLTEGSLVDLAGPAAEIWLDGGHNPHCAAALSEALATLEDSSPRALYLITAMRARKDAGGFLSNFSGLAREVRTLAIPGEKNSYSAEELAGIAIDCGLAARTTTDIETAISEICATENTPRILICGSLYFAGDVLRRNGESVGV